MKITKNYLRNIIKEHLKESQYANVPKDIHGMEAYMKDVGPKIANAYVNAVDRNKGQPLTRDQLLNIIYTFFRIESNTVKRNQNTAVTE